MRKNVSDGLGAVALFEETEDLLKEIQGRLLPIQPAKALETIFELATYLHAYSSQQGFSLSPAPTGRVGFAARGTFYCTRSTRPEPNKCRVSVKVIKTKGGWRVDEDDTQLVHNHPKRTEVRRAVASRREAVRKQRIAAAVIREQVDERKDSKHYEEEEEVQVIQSSIPRRPMTNTNPHIKGISASNPSPGSYQSKPMISPFTLLSSTPYSLPRNIKPDPSFSPPLQHIAKRARYSESALLETPASSSSTLPTQLIAGSIQLTATSLSHFLYSLSPTLLSYAPFLTLCGFNSIEDLLSLTNTEKEIVDGFYESLKVVQIESANGKEVSPNRMPPFQIMLLRRRLE